jgi:hypothetical protein
LFFLLFVPLALAAGCGGGGGGGSSNPRIVITPGTANVPLGGTQAFSAVALDAQNNPINGIGFRWTVVGGGGNGSIDGNGLYTPPSVIPTPNTIAIEAADTGNPSFKGSASVNIISGLTPVFSQNANISSAVPQVNTQSSGQHSAAVLGDQVFIGWSDNHARTSGEYDVYLARSSNRGQTFIGPIKVNQGDPILLASCSNPSDPTPCQVSLAIDQGGNAYIVWQDFRNAKLNIFFAKCPSTIWSNLSSGASCNLNKQIDPIAADASQLPTIAVDSTGDRIYIAWEDDQSADVHLTMSQDGGLTFSSLVNVNDPSPTTPPPARRLPSLAIGPGGDINVAWMDERILPPAGDIFFARSTDGGNSFLNIKVNDDNGGNVVQSAPSLAVDASGKIYIAWEDTRNGNRDIYFGRSIDGGLSFLPNVQLSQDTGLELQHQPTLTLDPYGNVFVAWQGDQDAGLSNIYFSKSMDGGNSFGPNIPISDTSLGQKNFPTLATDLAGRAYLFWTDGRTGVSSLFFSVGE